jgi:hypothetical protein
MEMALKLSWDLAAAKACNKIERKTRQRRPNYLS